MEHVTLNLEGRKSEIHCGEGAFNEFATKLADKQLYIVTDSNVYAFYRHKMWETFGADVGMTILTAGEKSKNHKNLIAILDGMLKSGMRRNCCVIAFGGGVVGDIAGLAAALYMRGVHLIQIPTTLLAQVDSSVGGKTAVDYCGVKNAFGTFYQPEQVIVDSEFLQTLPAREFRCGLGEIIKYGALNKEIFYKIQKNIGALTDKKFLDEITADCIRHKAEVVLADERDEGGVRKSLNLGHTTGHALELLYGKKSHGEFVLIGMWYELFIAEKYGICGGQYANELKKLILSVIKKVPVYENFEKAAEFAMHDKKNDDYNISMIVPKKEGEYAEIKLAKAEYVNLLCECANALRCKK